MGKIAIEESAALKDISKDELLELYRLMVLIRRFEESLYRKYREGKIGGYLHRYDGQEGLVAGVIPLLTDKDYILATYRDHAHAIACGTEPRAIMAELMGRATGCAGGKGGSMHLTDPERGFLGGDGIVGGPLPVSVGVGYAIKYRGDRNVCVCYFGDGAMNQGGTHEAFNMAGLYKIPVLYILENNGYAMGTSIDRSTGQTDFVLKARAHGIDGDSIDGMDVLKVRETAKRILDRMRQTGEPHFLEIKTYRYVGHGVADNPQQQRFYRSEEEMEEWKRRDPIGMLRDRLEREGILNSEIQVRIEQEINAIVEDSIEFAESSPEPPLDSLYENVFS